MSARADADDDLALASFVDALVAAYPTLGELTGGSVVDRDGLLMVAGPHRRALVANTAIRTDPAIPPAEVFRRTLAHYGPGDLAFDLCTFRPRDGDIDDAAAGAGWEIGVELPCMVIRDRPPAARRPIDTEIRWADPVRDHDVVGRIVAIAFGEADDERDGLRAIFGRPAIIGPAGWPSVIASVDGVDVAVASWAVRGGVGIVGFVSTLPDYRRRGLGALVTQLVTDAAFDAGASIVGLQASPEGLPVYERLGYETIGDSTIWKPPSA
jgi:GNAT superfamily N-acetyltransferase